MLLLSYRIVEESLKQGNVKMVMLESPTNPRMQVCDIRTISKMAHDVGALVLVDNSVLAPTFCQPLDLGADICMTSSTKFISGHSDVSGGILTVADKALGDQLYFVQVCQFLENKMHNSSFSWNQICIYLTLVG